MTPLRGPSCTCSATVCLAFEPVGGVSTQLVPDLARSIPTPTDGGLSYTFDLRPGIPYSNGERLQPSTSAGRSSESSFSSPTPPTSFFGLVGGEACHDEPRTCDLLEGS